MSKQQDVGLITNECRASTSQIVQGVTAAYRLFDFALYYRLLGTIVPKVPLVISKAGMATLTDRVDRRVEAGLQSIGSLIGGAVASCQAAEDQQQQDEPHA